jgi:hypothetical protein
MPGWGSWEWVGLDIREELSKCFQTLTFQPGELPTCDVLFVVKHPITLEILNRIPGKTSVIYCPVDHYGSGAELDQDGAMLRRCSRVIVHCQRLRRYFEPYTPVDYIDHHVKFVAPMRQTFLNDGYFLWVGVRSNLAPLVEWVNEHPLPGELRLLTNPENASVVPKPGELGFRRDLPVRIESWSPERHLEWTAEARAAIDIKGNDFRSRHKPPAKAMDFIASGLPLAINPDSSVVEHLARMGFDIPSPLDMDLWLSQKYWEETKAFGRALRELLSLERIGRRYRRIVDEVVVE